MTWRLARAQLVTILEAIPTSSIYVPGEYGPRFTHMPGILGEFGRARQFSLRGVSGDTQTAATGSTSRRTIADVELTIDYPGQTLDDSRLDDVLWTDYEVVREALLDVDDWNRPTSTIQGVTLSDRSFEANADDVQDDEGKALGRRLTIRFPVLHTKQDT